MKGRCKVGMCDLCRDQAMNIKERHVCAQCEDRAAKYSITGKNLLQCKIAIKMAMAYLTVIKGTIISNNTFEAITPEEIDAFIDNLERMTV